MWSNNPFPPSSTAFQPRLVAFLSFLSLHFFILFQTSSPKAILLRKRRGSRTVNNMLSGISCVFTFCAFHLIILNDVCEGFSTPADCNTLGKKRCPKENIDFNAIKKGDNFCAKYRKHFECFVEISHYCTEYYGFVYERACPEENHGCNNRAKTGLLTVLITTYLLLLAKII
ncbi:uncharacterized protein LOC128249749 [Octopus bimaculoides]|uniref:uncharacterized protein LOC128249749 n=1 Tax=Octopus bimaculoides TaxID=37653 RepID=UPI0022DF5A6E|nr:uncharacterized protein LOC128249749 [Octopus bimaculoides]